MRKTTKALAIADDLATLVLLDIYYLGIDTHKINKSIFQLIVDKKKFETIIKTLMNEFLLNKESTVNTAKKLILHINVHLPNLKIPSSKRLLDQLKFYLNLLNLNSGFEIQTCFRYVSYHIMFLVEIDSI